MDYAALLTQTGTELSDYFSADTLVLRRPHRVETFYDSNRENSSFIGKKPDMPLEIALKDLGTSNYWILSSQPLTDPSNRSNGRLANPEKLCMIVESGDYISPGDLTEEQLRRVLDMVGIYVKDLPKKTRTGTLNNWLESYNSQVSS